MAERDVVHINAHEFGGRTYTIHCPDCRTGHLLEGPPPVDVTCTNGCGTFGVVHDDEVEGDEEVIERAEEQEEQEGAP